MRSQVECFARLIEAKLAANDHKGGWSGMTNTQLVARLMEEVAELASALKAARGQFGGITPKQIRAIGEECADVAGFAMMIADNNAALVEFNTRPVGPKSDGGLCTYCGRPRNSSLCQGSHP